MRALLPLCLLALQQAPDVLPFASAPTKAGVPIVAAQGGPWAVVSLHVRVGDDLTPAERRSLKPLAQALAAGEMQGRPRPIFADASDVGGTVKARVDSDSLAIAWGAPSERVDVLLRVVDETLRTKARLGPATKPVDTWTTSDPPVDPKALELAAPGTSLALPTSGGPSDAATLRALADKILRRDRIAIAVVGAQAPSDLLGIAQKTFTATLPPSSTLPGTSPLPAAASTAPPPIAPIVLPEGTRLVERNDPNATGAASTVWLLSPGRGTPGADARDRAARAVLARMAGGVNEGSDELFAVAFLVTAARPSQIARAEAVPMRNLEAVATTAPPAEVVEAARAQEKAARLERLKDATEIADALGRALLAGDPSLVSKEANAIGEVTPDDVVKAAKLLATGPRVVVRALGVKR